MSQASTDKGIGFRVSRRLVLLIYGFAIVCTVILAIGVLLELFNANEGTPIRRSVWKLSCRRRSIVRSSAPLVGGASKSG